MPGNHTSSAGGSGRRNLHQTKEASQREDNWLFESDDEAPEHLGIMFESFVVENHVPRIE